MNTDYRAHPEPEDLTDKAILRTAAKELDYEFDESWFLTGRNFRPLEAEPLELLNFARAVIAADRARYGRPAVAPVAVSERPWEREGWCDARGMCWVGEPKRDYALGQTGDFDIWSAEWKLTDPTTLCGAARLIALLPHWAIPLPITTQEPDR
jgi:hypothetical protein